ncbi:MAG: hypothetical protein WAK40_00800 [Thermoplasmata archaeon]
MSDDVPLMAKRVSPRTGREFYKYLVNALGARDRAFEDPPDIPGARVYSVSTKSTVKGNSLHIQFYKYGGYVYIYGHVEPDSLARPLGHLDAWLRGTEVSHGLGRRAVQVMFDSWYDR